MKLNYSSYGIYLFILGLVFFSILKKNMSENLVSVQATEFSSFAENRAQLPTEELLPLTDDELIQWLSRDEVEWAQKPVKDSFYLSASELEEFEANTAYNNQQTVLNTISGNEALVAYQEEKSCKPQSLSVEKYLVAKGPIQNLVEERSQKEISQQKNPLPRQCLTHVMNTFNLKPKSFAKCPKGAKYQPVRGGTKPCITQNYVNVTYNSLVDVAECLNFDPKDLLPKLFNESGVLINTLGAGFDTGVGQLTGVAIEEVNKYYDKYLAEMEKASINKPACLRLMKSKVFLKKVGDALNVRCSLIAPPENPLKNIVYMGILNRRNLDVLLGTEYIAGEEFVKVNEQYVPLNSNIDTHLQGKFGTAKIKEKMQALGLKNVDYKNVATMVALAGYNSGNSTSFNIFNDYLTQRMAAKLPLTEKDFDFHNPKIAKDIDGQERSVIEIAKLNIRSAFIKKGTQVPAVQLQRAKLLPEKIRKSYTLSYPEFLIYNQNNFEASILNPKNIEKIKRAEDPQAEKKKYETFSVIGGPGYLSHLALKDISVRKAFSNSGADPFFCSKPEFLKIK